ncbi:MAG: PadR family transcriptional regulator [Acidimicrobiales bacterium]
MDVAILGLLVEDAQHGYELHRRMLASFGMLFEPSWGSLYPTLSRLERNGYIESTHASSNRIRTPSTGSLSGEIAAFRAANGPSGARRQRKVYEITTSGRSYLVDLLERLDVSDDRAFWVGLAFSTVIEPQRRAALAHRRRYILEDRLRDLKDMQTYGNDGMRTHVTHGLIERLSGELGWLDSLLEVLSPTSEGDGSSLNLNQA